MDFSIKRALEVAVVFACAIGVGSTAIIMTNNNNDRTKSKNDGLWSLVDKNGNGSSDSGNNPTAGPNGEPLVSKTESQVGKYADIDDDGTVDGIIFADLMVGGSGEYGSNNRGTYTIPTISSSKDYYVSQQSYTNALGGTAEVLSPTGSGAERFYIMALSDVSSESYCWYKDTYYNDISDYNTVTSENFGTGKSNTATMISKWNNKAYGEQTTGIPYINDIWGQIQTQVNNDWFVPSKQEWAAFANNLDITSSSLDLNKGLNVCYWSSSLFKETYAYNIYFFSKCCVDAATTYSNEGSIRLAHTF